MIFSLVLSAMSFFHDTTLPENQIYCGYLSTGILTIGMLYNMPVLILCGSFSKLFLSYDTVVFINKKRAKMLDLEEEDFDITP